MKFIDLFAGLGGFNLALSRLGHKCVYASEINETLRSLYMKNFNIMPDGDIRNVDVKKIPEHDILCAGFPCQPFSKAGLQEGLNDRKLGGLYKDIHKVMEYHHPKYFILENVPNLETHDNGKTWELIKNFLEQPGYNVNINKFSPHHFGIPQIRERVYIVGSKESLESITWPKIAQSRSVKNINDYLDHNPKDARKVPKHINQCLDVWQEFLNNIPRVEKIPHPIWSMEFGASYPYEQTTPCNISIMELRKYLGSHGQPLSDADKLTDLFNLLPSHARRIQEKFPRWKRNYIRKNREFYKHHKTWLDDWIPKILEFPSSLQKLEWNCQGERVRDIRKYIIQIRPSGVRVKRRTTIPSLVAMTTSQVPIIAWENRYITPKECMRLQSMDGPNGLKFLPESKTKAYKALGNSVNVEVVKLVTKALVNEEASPRSDSSTLEFTLSPVDFIPKKIGV